MGIFKVTATQDAVDRLEADLKRMDEADKKLVDEGKLEQTQRGYRGKGK